jgi:transposase
MSPLDLLTPEAGLAVTTVAISPDLIAIAATTAPTARCPRCDRPSDRVHSRYTRTAADLPWQGRRVILRVTVRCFRCRTAECDRAVFCERLPAVPSLRHSSIPSSVDAVK